MKNYSDFSDRELVEMTLVGDTDAFGELVTRHGPAVLNAARAVTRNLTLPRTPRRTPSSRDGCASRPSATGRSSARGS